MTTGLAWTYFLLYQQSYLSSLLRKIIKQISRNRVLRCHTSSITIIEQSFSTQTPFLARSGILLGVPMSKCTGWYKRMMASFRLVPPVVTMT